MRLRWRSFVLLGLGGITACAALPSVVLGSARAATTERRLDPDLVAPPDLTLADSPKTYYLRHAPLLARRDPRDLAGLDCARLRRGYFEALNSGAAQAPDSDLEEQLGKAFAAGDWPGVVRVADAILEARPTRIRAHLLKARALDGLGQDATFHGSLGAELAESILATGDGRSPQTAFHVFFVEEEYDVLKVLQLRVGGQSLMHQDGRHLDLLSATDAAGNSVELYFDITEHMAALRSLFVQ